MEPQQQKESKELEEPASRGPRRPSGYRVRVRGDVPDDLGVRVAELHAAALAMVNAGPPPATPKLEKSGIGGADAGTVEEVS